MSTERSFTIAQAAERAGVSVHTLRYYEQVGLIARVPRASSGHRRYTEATVDWVVFLTHLRATGMPIRHMRTYAELVDAGDHTAAERLALLESHREVVRAQLAKTAHHLQKIEYKIGLYHAHYGDDGCPPAGVDERIAARASQPAGSVTGL